MPGTRRAHSFLHDNIGWYRNWHHSAIRLPTHIFLAGLTMLFAVLIVLGPKLSENPQAAVGILKEFPFQGRLTNTDGTVVADADYDLTFKLYTVDVGGSAVWTEAHTGANDIPTVDGIFNTMLGSITSLGSIDFNSDTWWLGVTAESDLEMTPRVRLGAAPFAFNSDKLDGVDSTGFLVLNGQSGGQTAHGGIAASQNLVLRSTTHATKGNVIIADDGGDVGVGTTTPDFKLSVVTSTDGDGISTLFSGVTGDYAGYWMGVDNSVTKAFKGGILFEKTATEGRGNIHLVTDNNADDTNADLSDARLTVTAAGNIGIATTSPLATLDIAPTSTSGGSGLARGWLQVRSATYTDNATAASGTSANFSFSSLQTPTLAATNASVTTTNAYTLYIAGAPIAGTNMTITQPWAIQVQSGDVRFNGRLMVGGGGAQDEMLSVNGTSSGASGVSSGILQVRTGTYTDDTTAASGTSASFAFNGLQTPTLAATNASVTTTNAANLYIASAPGAGTNMTITNAWALWVDNGASRFDGDIIPGVNDSIDLGTDTLRWQDIYLGPGTLHVGTSTADEGTLAYDTTNNELEFAINSTQHLMLTSTGNAVFGNAALATSATAGFPYIPSMTGVPSGVPTSYTGRVPLTYNTTSNILYFYNSGWQAVGGGGSSTLQAAYDGGNTITTTSARNIDLTLADTATDSDLIVNMLGTGNTIEFRDTGTAFATWLDTGTALFKPTTNSTIAFQVQPSASGVPTFDVDTTNSRVGINVIAPTATLDITTTATSGASGTTRGWLQVRSATYTDNVTAAAGTAASFAFNAYQTPTLAATNTTVTTTNAATLYIAAQPTAGTNMTITNAWALWVDGGNARFDGNIMPGVDNTLDLGSSALRWQDIFVGTTLQLGTTPAASGMIRLPNNQSISARNVGNTADVSLISLNATDDIQFGSVSSGVVDIAVGPSLASDTSFNIFNAGSGSANLRLEGSLDVYNANGLTGSVATTGDINLTNTGTIMARNVGDSADIHLISLGTADTVLFGQLTGLTSRFELGTTGAGDLTLQFMKRGTGMADLNIEGSLNVHNTETFGAALSTTGDINLRNTGAMVARNVGDSADIHLISLGTADTVLFGQLTGFTSRFELGTTTAGDLALQFMKRGSGSANLGVEGVLNIYNSSDYVSTAIAASGIIRIPNNQSLSARNAANTADISLISLNATDDIQFGSVSSGVVDIAVGPSLGSDTNLSLFNVGSGSANLRLEGSLDVYNTNGLTGSVATAGDINLSNAGSIMARNAGDTANITLLVLDATNVTNIGAPLFVDPTGTQTGAPASHIGFFRVDAATFQDTATAAAGTAAQMLFNTFERPTLTALNTTVTTTNAATVYIENSPLASTNETITNAYALWVDNGDTRLDGSLILNGSFLPGADDTYDLGSSALRWRDLYLGPSSLHIVSTTAETTTARDWELNILETGGAEGDLQLFEGSQQRLAITRSGQTEAGILMTLGTGGSDLMINTDTDTSGFSIIRSTVGSGISFYGAADVNALTISRTSSNVGIGTTTPTAGQLHVVSTGAEEGVYFDFPGAAVDVDLQISPDVDSSGFTVLKTTKGSGMAFYGAPDTSAITILSSNSNVGIICADPDNDLEVGGTGTGCNTGTRSFMNAGDTAWSNSSSRAIKQNFNPVSGTSILDKISAVPVYTYDFKPEYCNDHCTDRMGMVAEDFHAVFNRGEATTINGHEITMALWLASQALNDKVKALETAMSKTNISIDTNPKFDQVSTRQLAVSGNTSIKGKLFIADAVTLESTLSVQGDASFAGNLSIEKDLTIKGSILGSTQTRGIDVKLEELATEFEVKDLKFPDDTTYAVSVTPQWSTNSWVTDKTKDGFKIHFAVPAPLDATFDYLIQR